MAVDIEKEHFHDSMNNFFSSLQETQSNPTEKEPPGGAIAGGKND